MNRLTTTSKLKKDKIFSFGLPAGETCLNAKGCKEGCYAKQGCYRFKQVREHRQRNLEATYDLAKFKREMIDEIYRRSVKILRIHDSGDFYNGLYMLTWFDIAHHCPGTKFYAYTKSVLMFKGWDANGVVPPNFTAIFSLGGVEDSEIDLGYDKHARVFPTEQALKDAGYTNGTESDLVALGPAIKIGLVYHGAKNYGNTTWEE
jgi:hypothetical protein